ncbi:CPBP family glutamic-type intramembrane protease [Frateuria aurantia]
MPRLGASLATAIGMVLLLALGGWLGRCWVGSELALTAQHEQRAWLQGLPRWQWILRDPRQLIASRIFGPARASAEASGLSLQAMADADYQLGLRLDTPVDLKHWPVLALDYRATQPVSLGLIAVAPSGYACYSAASTLPMAGHAALRLDSISWQTAERQSCRPGPATALRLVLRSPAGVRWQLSRVALYPGSPPSAGTSPPILLPAWPQTARAVLATAERRFPEAAAPEIGLSAATPAGHMLQLRDAARLIWPGAIVQVRGATTGLAAFRLPWPWVWLALYGLGLARLLRPSRPRRRDLLDAVAVLLGPLWLIIGMHFGRHPAGASAAAATMGLAYAAWLGWHSRAGWHWLGRVAGDWLRPFALLPVAALLICCAGGPLAWPGPGHMLGYLAWACLQQWLMLTVLLPRLQHSLPAGVALPATAGVFMLLHMPNGELMQACLLAELYWAWCFQRDRGLLPIAVAHAAAALTLQAGLGPQSVIRSLEVSARFLN